MTKAAIQPAPPVRVRAAEPQDLDALVELEQRVFDTDQLSRRSLRRFLSAPSAENPGGGGERRRLAGTAIVLFRPRSAVARLYSIAVAPHMGGRGVASMLLRAAEECALRRRCALDPARSARDQRRSHLPLPQERLPGVRSPLPLLRGRRRRAAVREAAYPRNFLVWLMPRARIVSRWDNPTDTWRLTLFRPNTGPHRGRSEF